MSCMCALCRDSRLVATASLPRDVSMRVHLVAALLVIAAVLLVWSASKLSAHGQQQRSIGRRSLGRVNASSQTSPAPSAAGTDAPLIFRYVDEMPANKSLPSFVTISKSPRVLYFPALLTADEAAALIKLGEESLAPSGVWHGDDAPSKSPPPKTSHHRRQHTHQPHEKAQGVQRRHVLSVHEEGDDTTFNDRLVPATTRPAKEEAEEEGRPPYLLGDSAARQASRREAH
jgi:hypothetical protein